MIKFNDPKDWLEKRINGVKKAYLIPNEFSGCGIAIDIGANVGAFPIVNHNKFEKIICIEPSKYSYNECKKNIENFNNIEVYNYAVSNVDNKIVKLKTYKNSNQSGNASTIDSELWDDNNFEEVKTLSLEGIFKKFNLDRVNYLKVDCEGSEYDLLMNKDLSKVDYLAVEIHIQLKEKTQELYDFLLKNFYIISKLNDGIKMHYELTLKNKLI